MRSRRGSARRRRSCTCSTRATASSASTTSTAARTGCSPRSTSRRATASRTRRPPSSRPIPPRSSATRALVWLETPTNPLLNVVDIAAVAAATRAAGALLVVDNTFATPYLQSRSTSARTSCSTRRRSTWAATRTSSAGSPGRTTRRSRSGCVSSRSRSAPCRARSTRGSCSAASRPSRCAWTATAPNARAVVEFLAGHPRVERVLWPGLPDHPGHEIAARQMRDFGGMVSFLLGSEEEAVELVARTSVWTLAESLGGVESLIEHPARMTHASTATGPFAAPREPRPALGRDRGGRRPRRRPRARPREGPGAGLGRAAAGARTRRAPVGRQRVSRRG